MPGAQCIACKREVLFRTRPKKGQFIHCPHCNRKLEIIRVSPPLLDWPLDPEDYINEPAYVQARTNIQKSPQNLRTPDRG